MILPALTEATSPFFRPIKYSLFPPLGLATLAAYLSDDDDVAICDEHVEKLQLDDEPDLVVIQVYITSARRSYEIADHYRRRGARVVLGGLHVTSLPDEAAAHADHIFMGPGEDTWPQFLDDLRRGAPLPRYVSRDRTLAAIPSIARSRRSIDYPGGISTSSTIISSGIRTLRPPCSMGWPAWAASGRRRARSNPCSSSWSCSRRRCDRACEACSSALRRSTQPTSRTSANTRTSGATTPRPSAACTTWVSWSTAALCSAWTTTSQTCSIARSSGPSTTVSKPRPTTS